jgi:hypothetical protein
VGNGRLCRGGTCRCGGGDSSSDTSQPLSKREYQQELIRLYIDAQGVGDIYPNLEIESASQAKCNATLHHYVDLVSSLIERLADLNPPPTPGCPPPPVAVTASSAPI